MITDRKEDSLMIGKIRKGRSFGGCIRYVTQKDDAEIIASEGVLLGTAECCMKPASRRQLPLPKS